MAEHATPIRLARLALASMSVGTGKEAAPNRALSGETGGSVLTPPSSPFARPRHWDALVTVAILLMLCGLLSLLYWGTRIVLWVAGI